MHTHSRVKKIPLAEYLHADVDKRNSDEYENTRLVAITMFKESIILLALSSSICDILPCWLGSLLGSSSSEDICDVVDDNHRTTSNQIKCIYIALRTSADISKCCTETQPKTPNSKQCRCKNMFVNLHKLHLKLDVVVLSIPDLRKNCVLQLHTPAGKWVYYICSGMSPRAVARELNVNFSYHKLLPKSF
jgi:hypothetical protein